MLPIKPKVIIFDYDMTLADTLPFFEEAITKQLHGRVTREEVHEIAKNTIYSRIGIDTHNIKWDLVRMFYVIARRSGYNPITSLWKAWKSGQFTKKEYSAVKPVEGTVETIKLLRKRNIKTAILSMSSRGKVNSFLTNNSLQDAFDLVVTKEMFRGTKRTKLQEISKHFNVIPEECLMVGDLPGDITSAKESGLKSAGVTTGAASRELLESANPDLLLSSVKDLPSSIE